MKTRLHPLSLLLLSTVLVLSSGCLTPEELRANRIQEHAALFCQLPLETQMRVQAGTIAIGDSATAVWFAFGEPATKAASTSASGTTETWVYTRTVSEPYEVLVYDPPPPPPPPPAPGMRPPPPPRHRAYHYETQYRFKQVPAMQVSFLNGAVVHIQTF